MKRYYAQALAVVLIVLVIASIIGLAMFSRVLRDNTRVVNEKSSAEALEITDSTISAIKGASVADIKTVCANGTFGEGIDSADGCVADGISEVNQFFTDLGITADPQTGFSNCSDQVSDLELSTKLATADDELEIRPDIVRSFVIRGQTPTPASCTLNITTENRGASVSGLIISKIYGKNYVNGYATDYKTYAYDDILSYCVHSSGGDCTQDSRYSSTWVPIETGSTISIPLGPSASYSLDELRLRATGGIVAVRASLSDANCIKDWEMIKMVVGANCTGSYRAKEVQIPQQEWALPLFDYVVYNGNGILQSE